MLGYKKKCAVHLNLKQYLYHHSNFYLNNFRDYEGFENRDKFKLKAVNSLLMDLGHLREDQPQGTPIELNLMI